MKKVTVISIFLIISFLSIANAESELFVEKGDFRAGLMGSFQKGRLAGSLFNDVSSFTIETEIEYMIFDYLSPITRMGTTIAFLGEDSITDFVWGLGLKGIFNFKSRFVPYIKFIPSVHVFNYNLETLAGDGTKVNQVNFDILVGVGLDILLTRNVAFGFAFQYEVIFSHLDLDVYGVPFGFSFYFK